MNLKINGENRTFDAPGDMPLLWVLRDVRCIHLNISPARHRVVLCCKAEWPEPLCSAFISRRALSTNRNNCRTARKASFSKTISSASMGHHDRRRRRNAHRREGSESLAGPGSDPMRLLPVRPNHVGGGGGDHDTASR